MVAKFDLNAVQTALTPLGYVVVKRFTPSGRHLGYTVVSAVEGTELHFTTLDEVRSFARSPSEWHRQRRLKLARSRRARKQQALKQEQ